MKASFIIRFHLMVIALVGILFLMKNLNSGTWSESLAQFFGIDATHSQGPHRAQAPAGTVVTQLDWCDTRVKSLTREGEPTLLQQKLKWLWDDGKRYELNFVAVEKWFGRYCRVRVERVSPAVLESPRAAMVVEFIKGGVETLYRSANGYFSWKGEAFKSEELEKALQELSQLPDQGMRTTH